MASKPLTMSPGYVAMVRGTRELHRLLADGKDDSPEAEAIRDVTDGPWRTLSEVERNRVRNLSEDLYSLIEPPPVAQPMTPEAQSQLNEAFEARQRGEWDRALDLLRRWRARIDPPLVSYLRGRIWLEAGDPATAALFFEHAWKLDRGVENYLALFLHALSLADPATARQRADEVLQNYERYSPVVVARAADIALKRTRKTSLVELQRLFNWLEPILKSTLAKFDELELSQCQRSSYIMTIVLLGFGYELMGKRQAALECYSQGMQLDPDNDALLVARGNLLYGTSPRAITDLEQALRAGTRKVWPFVVLAHHNLLSNRFEECRTLCERVLAMDGSAALMSEVSEWLAIAQAELGFPAEMVRAAFEQAIRLDSCNDRAKRNLAAFEARKQAVAGKGWDTRTAGDVQASGLAERQFDVAA